MTPVLASLLMMGAAAGRHAPKAGAEDATPMIALLAGAVLVIAVSVIIAMQNARAWIKIYTSLTVMKRTAGQAYVVALMLYAVLLGVLGVAFSTPFYRIAPLNAIYHMAANLLHAPPVKGGMPDLTTMYAVIHAIITGVLSAFVVMLVAGSVARLLAGTLRKPPLEVQ